MFKEMLMFVSVIEDSGELLWFWLATSDAVLSTKTTVLVNRCLEYALCEGKTVRIFTLSHRNNKMCYASDAFHPLLRHKNILRTLKKIRHLQFMKITSHFKKKKKRFSVIACP